MERTILHSDMNNFYASVEIMLNPKLKGKAVAVCGSTETRHGIVLAKSETAKKAGVKTGMANWEAANLCPGLITIQPHFERYLKYSKLAKEIYNEYTNQVEPYGMDECFLDVTGSYKIFGSGMSIAQNIRNEIKNELGLTVSIGVSFNKVFAKLGSDMKKPDAVTEIKKAEFMYKIWPLDVSRLLYVGRSTEKKLKNYGITTIGALAKAQPNFLNQILGKNGLMLHSFANGLDTSPVMESDYRSPVKSIGHGITCTSDLVDNGEVWKVIFELSQDIGRRLITNSLRAGGVQVSIRDSSLFVKQFQGKMPYTTLAPIEIAKKAYKMFIENYSWNKNIRSVTVRAINLVPENEARQITLFENASEKQEKVFKTIEDIRRRFGKNSICAASLMGDIKMPAYRDHGIIMPGLLSGI